MNERNSECVGSWMHHYEIIKVLEEGVIERCEICNDEQFFHNDTPNHIYLSYHLRSTLNPRNLQFYHEYRDR